MIDTRLVEAVIHGDIDAYNSMVDHVCKMLQEIKHRDELHAADDMEFSPDFYDNIIQRWRAAPANMQVRIFLLTVALYITGADCAPSPRPEIMYYFKNGYNLLVRVFCAVGDVWCVVREFRCRMCMHMKPVPVYPTSD